MLLSVTRNTRTGPTPALGPLPLFPHPPQEDLDAPFKRFKPYFPNSLALDVQPSRPPPQPPSSLELVGVCGPGREGAPARDRGACEPDLHMSQRGAAWSWWATTERERHRAGN